MFSLCKFRYFCNAHINLQPLSVDLFSAYFLYRFVLLHWLSLPFPLCLDLSSICSVLYLCVCLSLFRSHQPHRPPVLLLLKAEPGGFLSDPGGERLVHRGNTRFFGLQGARRNHGRFDGHHLSSIATRLSATVAENFCSHSTRGYRRTAQ